METSIFYSIVFVSFSSIYLIIRLRHLFRFSLKSLRYSSSGSMRSFSNFKCIDTWLIPFGLLIFDLFFPEVFFVSIPVAFRFLVVKVKCFKCISMSFTCCDGYPLPSADVPC